MTALGETGDKARSTWLLMGLQWMVILLHPDCTTLLDEQEDYRIFVNTILVHPSPLSSLNLDVARD
ncbi:hypothetical protein EYZ11_000511 [Aspergillus tanneri]|uniref:Uncharacterized protein n=1 Tax=Aspergillus tanneri TaxID=1220188 RepID=A0A4S3JX18_9EURO|nr:hypothetical protein EYZ11_000511 [Aspergillus tanneri]